MSGPGLSGTQITVGIETLDWLGNLDPEIQGNEITDTGLKELRMTNCDCLTFVGQRYPSEALEAYNGQFRS